MLSVFLVRSNSCAVAGYKHFPFRLAQSFFEVKTFGLPIHPQLPHARCKRIIILFHYFYFVFGNLSFTKLWMGKCFPNGKHPKQTQ